LVSIIPAHRLPTIADAANDVAQLRAGEEEPAACIDRTGVSLPTRAPNTRTSQAHLGHRNIQHTARYTDLSPTRFKNLWRD
jgi:hypothetical protein